MSAGILLAAALGYVSGASRCAAADPAAKGPATVAQQRELVELRQENARLRRELEAARTDNEQLQAATTALRLQLESLLTRVLRSEPAEAADKSTSAPSASGARPNPLANLQLAKAPPSEAAHASAIGSQHSATPIAPSAPENASSAPVKSEPAPTTTIGAPLAAPPNAPPASAATAPERSPALQRDETPAASPAPPSNPRSRAYTVQRGDTLEKIATRFYGSASEWAKIYAANMELLMSNQGLKPGMELQVPP